jgi:hypothetical protein
LVGVSNEIITGVLPLYICDEHWKIGKEMMIPILAWLTTLDTNGYDA